VTGRSIVVASWLGTAALVVGAVPARLGVDAFGVVSLAVSLGLFVVALGVWAYAFVVAVARSANGDDIVVANLFCFAGPVPAPVRWHLFGSLAVCTVVALVCAIGNPFTTLAPMWPFGCLGLWGARHGTFPPR